MTTELRIFISSKMTELGAERGAVHRLLPALGSDLVALRPWVFEDDAPAADASIRSVYLDALKRSALYLGLFWNEYGEWTVDEFERATEWGIDRHIYVKNVDAGQRDARLQAFLDEQSNVIAGITPKWFESVDDLLEQVRRSIAVWLRDRLLRRPGDTSAALITEGDDVPGLPHRLIGRDAALGEIRRLLNEGGRVLLQGFGGMGKSALAAAAAADWLDDDRGAVLWLRAGSDSADTLFEALARPLGAQAEVAQAPPDDKAKTVRRLLAEGAIALLVLDDVWDGAALSRVLKAVPRRMPVLVTAQQRYALDHILEVGKLAEPDALALLGYYAGQDVRADPAARELCQQVGYHAFALEIAGKTLKVDRIAPGDLLARIAAAPHDLAMPEDFAEEGRTSTTELLTASLVALDEGARQAFLAFGGMFAPQVTPELLASAMARDEADVSEALITLQRRGLADRVRESDRSAAFYRVHDLAHSYARAVAGEDDGRRRAALAACRAYAEAHESDLPALDAELPNLLGAADAARQGGDDGVLVAIMRALAGPYLLAYGHTPRFLDLLVAAVEAAARLGPEHDETRHFMLGRCGNIHYDRGDLPGALACYQGALALARDLGRRDREAMLLCAVGKVLADQGADGAADHFAEAYQIAAALDDGFLVAFVLEHQGYYAQVRGDFAAARAIFAEEAELAARINDDETRFFALLNLGSAEHKLDRLDEALAQHRAALALAQAQDNPIWQAHALQSMGEDHHRLGDAAQARQCLSRARALFRESGMQAKVAEVETYMQSSDYTVAPD